jgi:hypothetical protein
VKSIKAQFVSDQQKEYQTARDAEGQPKHINRGVALVAAQFSECGGEIVLKHGTLHQANLKCLYAMAQQKLVVTGNIEGKRSIYFHQRLSCKNALFQSITQGANVERRTGNPLGTDRLFLGHAGGSCAEG